MTAADLSDTDGPQLSIFASRYRTSTLGILILMTIIAFEAMAVATAMPTAARSLHGLAAYGWSFTGFLVASIVGMVSTGLYSDARGPRVPLLVGVALFMSGLLVGTVAAQMWELVAGRVIQGLAVGVLITAMYVVLGEMYEDAIRPRIFAALATAWVVPGLVGPVIAGWVTEHLSWRWVFGGLAPFVALAGLLLLPSLRQLRTHTVAGGAAADPRRVLYALLTAGGIAAVAGVGERQNALSILFAVLGVVLLVLGMRRLLPPGTVTFRPGVPAAVAFRGVLAGTFFGMESVVPLTLSVRHAYSPTMSGLPLMLSALTWAVGSQIQGRAPRVNRALMVRTGLALMAAAGLGMALVALGPLPGWAAFAAWPLAGLGAGVAMTSTSVVLLEYTTEADRGSDSAALQLADSSAAALCTAFGGALVAAAAHGRIGYGSGLTVVFLVMAALGSLAILRAGRLRAPSPGTSGQSGGLPAESAQAAGATDARPVMG
jgi:MFS family permease